MTLAFEYDHSGLRTQKTVQTDWLPETTNYYLHGKLLTHMTVDYTDFDEVAHQDKLHFFYDAQSRPAQVSFNGIIYTYIHNLQGDIVGILDSTGALVVEYRYDAWGKPISTTGNLADTLGKRNPFRYRGYVYDEETGLYYLRSRYYNPEVGRFINADTLLGNVGGLGSHNLFAYCANEPVKRLDPNGYAWYDGIVNGVKKVGSFIKDCLQAQTKADMISAEQTVHAANEVTSSVKSLVSSVKTAVSDWWNNDAKPWLDHVKEAVKSALQAQQQADIASAQLTYQAGMTVGNWAVSAWKWMTSSIDNVLHVLSGVFSFGGIVTTVVGYLTKGAVAAVVGHVGAAFTFVGFGIYIVQSIRLAEEGND